MGKRFGWVLLVVLGALSPVHAHAQVQLDRYLKQDGYRRIKISPDGKHYAATVRLEDRVGLVILRRADKKVVAGGAGGRNSEVADFWWVSDDRVVIAMAERLGSRDQPYRTGHLFGLGIDGKGVKTLVGPKSEPGLVDTFGDTGPWEMASLIDPLPNDPRHVLIAVWNASANPLTRIDRLDVLTGRRIQVASAPVRRATFLTDAAGHVRFAQGARDDNYSKLYYRENDEADWRLVNDEAQTGHYALALGFSADGATAYLRLSQDTGPDAIVAWDPRTDARTEVLRDANVDPYAVLYDRDGRTVIGAQYMSDRMRTRLLDETGEAARAQRALERAFPDAAVNITSHTRDGVALVQVWNDRTPGDTYLFDPRTRAASGVFVQREWFNPATLPASREITLPARDGLTLHGYLTLPLGATGKTLLPMVVMPHGGPYGIFDELSFDDDTHLLAEAGYAVLRLNYRGSGNYGVSFQLAGAREWGGKMQDDLTDATHWAIAQHIADPSRICIYGASYGGYAALMGVAKEPGLYRCAVGYVGVYDLEAMHRYDSRTAGWMRNWADAWLGDRDSLDQRSPTTMAARIKAPVFLAAGGEDRTAPIVQSKEMARALRNAGTPVETLYVDSEGHGFYTEEHRREFYSRLLDFLARSLGGATAATGTDAAGSTGK